jgi:sugar phosphate isomerase/epimerase
MGISHMKLSISNIAWSRNEDEVVYELMKEHGFSGLEIAPTRLIEIHPYEHLSEAIQIVNPIKAKYDFDISSIQSILFGRTERLFGAESERIELIHYLKMAIDFAVSLRCHNLVFGSPQNRIIAENDDYGKAVAFFQEIAAYAVSHYTVVSVEANPPIYGTNFINRTEEAVQLVKDVNSKGFRANLDFGTMIENQEEVKGLGSIIEYVNHVHISEPHLAPIIERPEHKDLAEILNDCGYEKFVSIEMKRNETKNIAGIEKTLAYVEDTFGGK